MDEFDRSPEDISFDLNAEEFSLESILDEYKDFQTEKPAPRPRPAYRSRPVTAEMIEEAEAADAEPRVRRARQCAGRCRKHAGTNRTRA